MSSTAGPGVSNPVDPGRGPLVMGLLWTLTGLAVLVVVARLAVRRKMRALSWDDWLMLLAAAFQIGAMACITKAVTYGLGKRDAGVSFDDMVNILKWGWLNMIPGVIVSVLARVSSAIFLNRLFGTHRWLWWFLTIFTAIQCVAGALLLLTTFLGVQPVEALWNPAIPRTSQVNPAVVANMAYTVQALFTFADLTYVLFPVLIAWRLNMPIQRRIAVALLMCTSLVTMSASIMKAVTTQTVSSSATVPQYTSGEEAIWAEVEQTLVIIMASAPTLWAIKKVEFRLFKCLVPWLPTRLNHNSNKSSPAPAVAHYYCDLERNIHGLDGLELRENSVGASKDSSSWTLITDTVPQGAVGRN